MKQTIPVIGMACSACSANVERKLAAMHGVSSAAVSLATRTATVEYDPSAVSLADMKREISEAGYDLVIETGRSAEEINRRAFIRLKRLTMLSWLFAIATMAVGMRWVHIAPATPAGDALVNQTCLIIALLNMAYCGRQF